MLKKKVFFILAVFTLGILAGGCETFKGACSGFKKDWAHLEEVDAWMRENLW